MSGGRFGPFLLSPVRRMIAPGLRLVISGGAHLKLETELEMEALGWDVRGGYGLAETASSITAPLGGKKPGSTGRVVEGCAITIADTNTEGIGEILVKGPVVFSGYIDKPDANAKAFTKDGFFRTGDLGYLDEDGFLFVTGRKKEVIVLAGGDNIFPEEVEERYLGHTAVQEIGVFEKDGALVAVVLPDMADIARRRLIDPREVVSIAVAEIGKTLPSTWRLSGFVMTREPLPRTRLLKLRRFMLPAIYEDLLAGRPSGGAAPLSQEDLAWLAEDPQKTVWKLLQDRYPSSNLSLDGYISFELGLDSFGWMNLSLLIEDELEVRLSLSDIARIATARDFLKIVAERKLSGNAAEPRRNLVLDAVTRWLSPRTRFERILGHILYGANAVLMRMAFRVQLEGVDYVTPLKGRPFIICPNHVSDLDALALAAAVPAWLRSSIRWSGSRGAAFGTSFRSGIARAVGMFPVDQESPMVAVDLAAEALDRGLVQVWFPEGLLSPDGKLLLFHEGIGHVISRTSVPVVPAIMDGTYKAMPRERTFPRLHRIRVIFGPPVDPAELTSGLEGGQPDMKNIADRLREKLLATGDAHGIDLRGKADSP